MPDVVIGDAVPVTDIVVLPIRPTLVTVPLPLPLNVVQSACSKYPSVEELADGIPTVTVLVPATVIAPVATTLLTPVGVSVNEGYALVTVNPVPPVMVTVLSGLLFVTVYVPDPVIGDDPAIEIPVPATAPTLVTVPPLDGLVLVMVKFGYVPVALMPVPLVNDTVWSGAVFTTVKVPELVMGEMPVILTPVPATTPTLVTVPPDDGLLLVTVYVGKEPDNEMPVPAVRPPVAFTV